MMAALCTMNWGPAYTLMVLDANAQVKPLLEAAQQAPLKVLDVSE
jgi:hypothetical protein